MMTSQILSNLSLLLILLLVNLGSAHSPEVGNENPEMKNSGSSVIKRDSVTSGNPTISTIQSLFTHMKKHPVMEPEDLYKFIYQSSFGIAHFIDDSEQALRYLEHEITIINSEETVSRDIIEPLGPRFCRFYLQPYLQEGGNSELLVEAMMRCAKLPGDTASFLSLVDSLKVLSREDSWHGPDYEHLAAFFDEMKSLNWPAVHHSRLYSELYRPHYRVLTLEEALRLSGSTEEIGEDSSPNTTTREDSAE